MARASSGRAVTGRACRRWSTSSRIAAAPLQIQDAVVSAGWLQKHLQVRRRRRPCPLPPAGADAADVQRRRRSASSMCAAGWTLPTRQRACSYPPTWPSTMPTWPAMLWYGGQGGQGGRGGRGGQGGGAASAPGLALQLPATTPSCGTHPCWLPPPPSAGRDVPGLDQLRRGCGRYGAGAAARGQRRLRSSAGGQGSGQRPASGGARAPRCSRGRASGRCLPAVGHPHPHPRTHALRCTTGATACWRRASGGRWLCTATRSRWCWRAATGAGWRRGGPPSCTSRARSR
jgi:hypothetical protein